MNKSERANRQNKMVMEDRTDERGGERDEDGSMGRLPWQPSVSTEHTHTHTVRDKGMNIHRERGGHAIFMPFSIRAADCHYRSINVFQ